MPIALYRVDERLIHGQVVVGWGSQLRPQRYVVVDEELATSEWEQELYELSVPEGTEAIFVGTEAARAQLQEWRESPVTGILLTRDILTMLALAQGGLLQGEEINLGGLHAQQGREEVLPYLYLGGSDKETLVQLEDEGVRISARDLPGSPAVELATLLG
jgi:PTS system mannose-specific IIB component/fructoselysine and glucoselysine-specific PTS system IIB component